MPSLGLGLTLGSSNPFKGYDGDASAFISQAGIASSVTIPVYGDNFIPSSNNFTTSGIWYTGLSSVTPNAISNPFGTATDASLISNIQASYGNILRLDNTQVNKFSATGRTYLLSVYAKSGASNFIGFRLNDSQGTSDLYSFVNLTTGVATLQTPINGTNNSLTATNVGNGWWRVQYSFTNNTSTNNILDIACCLSTGATGDSSVAGTRSIYIWGAQLEVTTRTTPLPYAETTTNANTLLRAQLRSAGTLLTETISPRQQINDFVVGAKTLGIWSSLLCWPLRSHHNAGSGSTAYSLGGLQPSNATLSINSGWGTDGFSFATGDYMTSVTNNISKDLTIFLSARGNRGAYGGFPWMGGMYHPTFYYTTAFALGNATTGSQVSLIATQPAGNLATATTQNGLNGLNTNVVLTGSYKRNAVFNVRNLNESIVRTQSTYLVDETTTMTRMLLNGRWNNGVVEQSNPMTATFFAIITPNWDSVITQFNTLYKTTIGTNLGL
jgi:hypothetical protein